MKPALSTLMTAALVPTAASPCSTALVVAPGNHAFILRNSADASIGTNYVFGAGNSWGPIVDVRAGGDISSIPNSSHPDANFIH